MRITLSLHYRGPRTQRMNELQDCATRYLHEFVQDDLKFLGLPTPGECECAWRVGIIKCTWIVGTNSYLERYIRASFQGIHRDNLPERSISMVGLCIGTTHDWVRASSLREPTGPAYQSEHSHTRRTYRSRNGADSSVNGSISDVRDVAMRASRYSRADSASPPRRHARRSLSLQTRHREHEASSSPSYAGEVTPSEHPDRGRSEHRAPRSPLPPLPPSLAFDKDSSDSWDESRKLDDAVTIDAVPQAELSHLGQASNKYSVYPKPADPHLENVLAPASSNDAPSSITVLPSTAAAQPPLEKPPAPPGPSPSTTGISGSGASHPLQDLWDLQREISKLSAREIALTQTLQRMGMCLPPRLPPPPPPPERPAPAEEACVDLKVRALEKEICDLRTRVTTESDARGAAERALHEERRARACAEGALEDVRRERAVPFVVPGLVDALLHIARFTDTVVGEVR